jgi:hypothetical protein
MRRSVSRPGSGGTWDWRALDTPLLTHDRRLAAAAGHRAQIELI